MQTEIPCHPQPTQIRATTILGTTTPSNGSFCRTETRDGLGVPFSKPCDVSLIWSATAPTS